MKYCGQCKFYELTWDKGAPHGCRAYGFRTSGQPDDVVLQNTGMECQLREFKTGGKEKPSAERQQPSHSSQDKAVSVQLSKRFRR